MTDEKVVSNLIITLDQAEQARESGIGILLRKFQSSLIFNKSWLSHGQIFSGFVLALALGVSSSWRKTTVVQLRSTAQTA